MANNLKPEENKFHKGNGDDGKHYWISPDELWDIIKEVFREIAGHDVEIFDPCPYPLPDGYNGLLVEWGQFTYVNPPFGSVIIDGKKKGPTAWVRKCIEEHRKGKNVILVFPIDKWVLMLTKEILGENAEIRNLGDIKWLATEDRSAGKGTGRHIAMFILRANNPLTSCQAIDSTKNE